MKHLNRTRLAFFFLALAFAAPSAIAQNRSLKVEHTVQLNAPASRKFHVTSEYSNIRLPSLALSLPTWTPGWYTVENYFKNVLRFRVTDGSGRVLQPRMSKKQTWNVDTRGVNRIRVDFDYEATVLGLNQAKIANDYAFFTGIQMFLEPVGHRTVPATVRFEIPSGWKLISAMKETSNPMVFTVADYDQLVDSPTLMGKFDVTQFEVEGKPHYFTAVPAGTFNAEKSKRFTEILGASIKAEGAIFGGLPYEKYVAFYFFQPSESNASGALEHQNSYVAFAPGGSRTTPEQIIGTGAHEFFHLWNVKRIRPAEMWPYDYSRENETPLLWVSEGFTNYYGTVATYRGGVTTKEQFLNGVANAAAGIENTEARKYISPANSSVSTWAGYDTPTAFGISYYTQGQNLAALLDLSIRNDTDGRSSLDDVMRALFNENYKRGRGFTTNDMIGIINRLTTKNYTDFYNRYVFGTEVPDYDRIFGYAGYRLDRKPQTTADLGMSIRPRNGGFGVNGVEPNGSAERAGLRVGDVITKINGDAPFSVNFGALAGKEAKLTVSRDGKESDMTMRVGTREFTNFSLVEMPNASAKQLKIREGWLKR
jgi:predicted metalloprotease with PDZ domain